MADLISKIEDVLTSRGQKGVAGIWNDEHELVEAARKTREAGFKKFEAISPYPLHGIDEAMNIPRSYIPYITFLAGLSGCAFGVWFTWWTSAVDWPVLVGGKPMWSLPAFIPEIFELTILIGSLVTVASLFLITGLPKVNPPIIDPDLTSHKFALFVPEKSGDVARVEQLFKSLGAKDVRRTEF